MRKIHLVCHAFLTIALTAASARADVTLDDCFAAALTRSETVSIQEEAIAQAEERVSQAGGSLLPTVTGIATRTWQQPSQSGTGRAISPPAASNVRIALVQPLFRGLREFAALRQAKTLREAGRSARRQAEMQLYMDVAAAFFSVLSLEKDLSNLQQQITLTNKRVRELRERIRIGRSRVSESLTIESAVAAQQAEAEALRGQIRVAREALAFQTGLPAGETLRETAAAPPLQPLDHYLGRLEQRPDVTSGREQVEASEDGVSIAKGAHLPSLDLGANYYFVRPGLLQDSKWDFQLLLNVPIFAGGVIQSQVRQSASVRAQAELSLSRVRRLAEQEIRSLHSTVQAEQTQLQALASATRLSERNYSEQSREYRLGLVTNIDVLQALTSSQASRRAFDRASYAMKNDLTRLEAAAVIKPGPVPAR